MQTLAPIVFLLATLVAGCAAPPPQDPGPAERDPATITPAEMADIERRMVEAMMPGPEHQMLARYAGSWQLETTIWPQPGAEPMTMASTAESEMVLGGRFLMSRGSSNFMGQEVETLNLLGFDRRSKEFTLEAFDTMGTYSVGARGAMGADGRTAVLRGTDYDAIGQLTQVYDFVITWIDDDTFKLAIVFHDRFHAPDGVPFKMVEVLNRRS
jgi:hypothetical protein